MLLGRTAVKRFMSLRIPRSHLLYTHARTPSLPDRISVHDLQVRMHAGLDAWGRFVPQPVHIDAHLYTEVSRAGQSDHVEHTHNYGTLYRALERFAADTHCTSLDQVAEGCMNICLNECHAPYAEVHIRLPRALLHADAAGMILARAKDEAANVLDQLCIQQLRVDAILGVNPWERERKQRVIVDVDVSPATCAPYEAIAHSVYAHVQASACLTIESLATQVAEIVCAQHEADEVRVCISKPSAIMHASRSSVEVMRHRSQFGLPPVSLPVPSTHMAILALGSNLGERKHYIEASVQALDQHPKIQIVDTSFFYETAPMYYEDQPRFLNGACKIQTSLTPHELLDLCQNIEKQLGRSKEHVPRNGPRVVDVDIVLYDNLVVNDGERLIIPHARLHERAFVLRPVCDMVPSFVHPILQRTMASLLTSTSMADMSRVMPVANDMWAWGSKTRVMGILNTTPDSFSDGGEHMHIDAAMKTARQMAEAGVDLFDVGGQSTAPGRLEVSVEEERARVLPLIRALSQDSATRHIPISIDTYRAEVAQYALDAGACMVNDVSGGTRDTRMLDLVAERHCPYVVMHMRGDASTMTSLTHYEGGVVHDTIMETHNLVAKALSRGVRRWNLIVDPGIGFAKDKEGNLALLRELPKMVEDHAAGILPGSHVYATNASCNASLIHMPLLLGVSRKRFLGQLIQEKTSDPAHRMQATMAACVAAMSTGCVDIIRVHDVAQALDAVRISDAIWRKAS